MIRIVEEGPDALDRYAEVPSSFMILSRLTRDLAEERVARPVAYDYDELEPPSSWKRHDLRRWGFFAAIDGEERIGSAIVARDCPEVAWIGSGVALWDIRVLAERRGGGIGRRLFQEAARWSRSRGAREMRIETQDVNVPACRFYQRMGCALESATPGFYAHDPSQVRLLWMRALD